MDIANSLQSPTSQCNVGDVLPFCQTTVSVPFANCVVSHSVTFTTVPCQSAVITEFPEQQIPLRRSAELSSEGVCKNCKLEKIDSLNRQVVELLKKHIAVEVDGKEILGWYILLTAEDRKIIKEFGGLEEFLKGNSSLQTFNNWVTLKSKSSLRTFDNSRDISCSIMEKPESFGHKYSPNYSKVSSDRVLHPPEYGQSSNELVTDVIPLQGALWPDQTNTEEPSVCEYETQATPCLETWDIENACQLMSENHSYPDVSRYVQMKSPTVCESLHDSGITEGDVLTDSTNLVFKESSSVGEPDEIHSTIPFQTYRSDNSDHSGDKDCSASDTVEDETFLSVRSGSFHSRSSSLFSLDDTDVEQYTFEEALEDLSSFSFCNQLNHPPGLPFASTDTSNPSVGNNPPIEVKKASQETHLRAVTEKLKLQDMTSKTDCYNKGTPTIKTGLQFTGVMTTNGLLSQTQDTVQTGNGACKTMERCKGDGLPSASIEARAVKAELQVLDMQRRLCLQLCWKTQQQSMESEPPTDQPPTGARFNLMAALAEVDEKYQEMKKQIQSGIPLDTLKPLNMQLTEVKSPDGNLLKEWFMDIPVQNRSDGASHDFKKSNSVGNDVTSMSVSATQNAQWRGEGGVQNSATQSEMQQCYYVHVGNIAPSVTEEEVFKVFQKYKVSKVFIEDSSMTSRYAVLTFTSSEQVQAAVKEMDGKELWGKKLKVREVKSSNCNLSLPFQTSANLPKEVKIGSTVSEGWCPSQPPTCSRAPIPGPYGESPIAQGGGSGRDFFLSVTNQYGFFPFNNVNKVFPAAPYRNNPNVLPPSHQWMLPAPYPNRAYSGTPYPMAVPYRYPLSTSPSCAPCPPQFPMANTNIFTPDINMKSNAPTYVGKLGSNYVPVKPMKPMHASNSFSKARAKFSTVRPGVQQTTRPSAAGTPVLEREANAGDTLDKPTVAQSVDIPAPLWASDNWKPVTKTLAAPCEEGTAASESVSSSDNVAEHTSGPSIHKPAAPLRVPTFVPCSVTIEENTETSSSAISNTGALSQSTDNAHVSSTVADHPEEPPPYTLMDWSMAEFEKEAAEFNMIVIPNRFNFYQFNRVFNYLTDHHKDLPYQEIVNVLEEMRISRGGYLCGVPIPEILAEACSKLAAKRKPPV